MLKILTLKAISTVFNWIVVRLFTWNWPGLNKFIKPDQYRISRKSRWLGTCDLCQYCSNTYRKKNTHTHVLIWAVIVLFCSYNSSIHTLVHRHIVAYAVSTCFYDCVVYFSLTNKQINRMKLWKNVFIFQKKFNFEITLRWSSARTPQRWWFIVNEVPWNECMFVCMSIPTVVCLPAFLYVSDYIFLFMLLFPY